MFTKGFKKKNAARINTAQFSTMESENKALYPAPNMASNVSGTDKYAGAMPGFQPKAGPLQGSMGGPRSLDKPARITTDLGNYGAPKGASGVTGVSNMKPFGDSLGKFGRKPRLGLKSITRVKRGL